MKKIIVIFSLLFVWGGPVYGASELSQINAQIKQTEQQNKKLEQQVKTSNKELSKTKKELVRAADKVSNLEDQRGEMAKKIAELDAQRDKITREMDANRARIADAAASILFVASHPSFDAEDMREYVLMSAVLSGTADMLDEEEKLPRIKNALLADAIATSAGAVLGTSTTTTFVESSAGVGAGARTGLASIVTGFLFLIAIFFAPIFTAIPGFATAPALIFVGFLMVSTIVEIDFSDASEALPAYLCVIAMPLMYSISEGIAIGTISYVLIKLFSGKGKTVKPLMYILAVLFVCKYIFL